LKVFFDNCTTPVFAGALDAFIRPLGHQARHVRQMDDYGFTHNTEDVDWIKRLGSEGDWIVITGDQRIRKNLAERTAWKRAGLKGFVLARAYQKRPVHQVASVLLWRWPEMEQFIRLAAPGSMFELPISLRSGGFTPLPV
jgi:hypothetical protein